MLRGGPGRYDADGQMRDFGPSNRFGAGIYRLAFDLSAYSDATAQPFLPEIAVTFRMDGGVPHVHVPVSVSPYGYSTYRGN